MVELKQLLEQAVVAHASDIFIMAGMPLTCKVDGKLIHMGEEKIMPAQSEAMVREIYELGGRDVQQVLQTGDDDFSVTVPQLSRFRISIYKQRGSLAAVIRVIPFGIPDYKSLQIPESVMAVAEKTKGLVLVTGPAGGGKSTTLACVIDRINHTREGHIITLEEPIEYLHRNAGCAVSQREIGLDTESYLTGLRASLRQAPDVILLGEMRDYETIRTAMTAAETGHLVIATLHTLGAANTIDRIIDVFPANQQQQIRVQLAMVLQTVISQQLVPLEEGGLMPVFEIMHLNNAVRNMVRESKIHQLDALMASSAAEGMVTMDASLLELAKQKRISKETAVKFAANAELMEKRVALL
ncbi:MAG: PilT/PilU family type 4a pilus ATPase [Peptococcaceae bacterium]|nr:PilT/PilU family type 4a pilus ATPase [Peptococcaceae bacterium]MBR2627940.1 PilT/PilU family type 4a pilus ATPase [Peptococcaceae bacterium]